MKPTMIVAAARSSLGTANLSFHDMVIELDGKESATVKLAVRIKGTTSAAESFVEAKAVVCNMVKIDREWLFKKCDVVEVFKK